MMNEDGEALGLVGFIACTALLLSVMSNTNIHFLDPARIVEKARPIPSILQSLHVAPDVNGNRS